MIALKGFLEKCDGRDSNDVAFGLYNCLLSLFEKSYRSLPAVDAHMAHRLELFKSFVRKGINSARRHQSTHGHIKPKDFNRLEELLKQYALFVGQDHESVSRMNQDLQKLKKEVTISNKTSRSSMVKARSDEVKPIASHVDSLKISSAKRALLEIERALVGGKVPSDLEQHIPAVSELCKVDKDSGTVTLDRAKILEVENTSDPDDRVIAVEVRVANNLAKFLLDHPGLDSFDAIDVLRNLVNHLVLGFATESGVAGLKQRLISVYKLAINNVLENHFTGQPLSEIQLQKAKAIVEWLRTDSSSQYEILKKELGQKLQGNQRILAMIIGMIDS